MVTYPVYYNVSLFRLLVRRKILSDWLNTETITWFQVGNMCNQDLGLAITSPLIIFCSALVQEFGVVDHSKRLINTF